MGRVLSRIFAVLVVAASASAAMAQTRSVAPRSVRPVDTAVASNAGACCVGNYYSLTTSYIAQVFTATGRIPKSITVNFANNLPGDVPQVPATFRLVLSEVAGSFRPGKILWESSAQALPVNFVPYSPSTLDINHVQLEVGRQYAWILDTYSDRTGSQFAMAYQWNDGLGTQGVAPYTGGAAWFQSASGQSRTADFTYPWTYGYGSVAFVIHYNN